MRVSRVFAYVLAAVMGLLPAAPPEHMHEDHEQGHTQVLVHRHLQPHAIAHAAGMARSGSIEDDDDHAVATLSTDFTIPSSVHLALPQPIGNVGEPLKETRCQGCVAGVDNLIHGPPLSPTGLRAPPASLIS